MSYLVASAERTDLAALRDQAPQRWRELRRFNAPVQLGVAAAHDVLEHARNRSEIALVALAPCQSGSPEIHRWTGVAAVGGQVRINPTHTLHMVDNLTLSVLSIALGDHAWGISLGGTPGMVWVGLELVGERIDEHREMLVVAGDQTSAELAMSPCGIALLFARERTPYGPLGRAVRLVAVERRRSITPAVPVSFAAAGIPAMLAALGAQPPGRFAYVVPDDHGDGVDHISVVWELG